MWERRWQAGEERHLIAVRGWFPLLLLLETCVLFAESCCWIETIHAINRGCHSPVSALLLLPSLLFIKPWQSAYNFSPLLMENESVEFMILFFFFFFFGRLLNWKRSSTQILKRRKPFSQVFRCCLAVVSGWMCLRSICLRMWRNQWKPGDARAQTVLAPNRGARRLTNLKRSDSLFCFFLNFHANITTGFQLISLIGHY